MWSVGASAQEERNQRDQKTYQQHNSHNLLAVFGRTLDDFCRSPAVCNRRGGETVPCFFRYPHGNQLVYFKHVLHWCPLFLFQLFSKQVYWSQDGFFLVVGLEAFNYACIKWLNTTCEVGIKEFDSDVGNTTFGKWMAFEVVKQEQDISAFLLEFWVPRFQPPLKNFSCHPSFSIVSVFIVMILGTVTFETSWSLWLSDKEKGSLLTSISIACKCYGHTSLVGLDTMSCFECEAYIRWHTSSMKWIWVNYNGPGMILKKTKAYE